VLSGNISTAEHSAESLESLSESDQHQEEYDFEETEPLQTENSLGKRNFDDWGEMKIKDMNHYQIKNQSFSELYFF
jgi:hypothetical protein